jgi:hypothetical protein
MDSLKKELDARPGLPPILLVYGNHEMDGVITKLAWQDLFFPGVLSSAAQAEFGPDSNEAYVYYSFDYGSTHFIALDGWNKNTSNEGFGGTGFIKEDQMAWLEQELANNTDKRVVIFSHAPMTTLGTDTPYYANGNRGKLAILASQYDNIEFVFGGHIHDAQYIKGFGTRMVRVGASSPHVLHVNSYGLTFQEDVSKSSSPFIYDSLTHTDYSLIDDVNSKNKWFDYDLVRQGMSEKINNNIIFHIADAQVDVLGSYRDNDISTAKGTLSWIGSENTVNPTEGSEMIKVDLGSKECTASNCYQSDHGFLGYADIFIVEGMKLSFDINFQSGGSDNVGITTTIEKINDNWAPIFDQDSIGLFVEKNGNYYGGGSIGCCNGMPGLGSQGDGQWHNKVFDLSPLAGNFIGFLNIIWQNVSTNKIGPEPIVFYLDNIKLSWPDDGTTALFGTEHHQTNANRGLSLIPNPANPSTTISYNGEAISNQNYSIQILDLKGRQLKNISGKISNGQLSYRWDGKNLSGKSIASGAYFISLKIGDKRLNKRFALIK